LWNEDTFRITLRQIEHYKVAGFFANQGDIIRIFEALDLWIDHIKKQAEYGFKFPYGTEPQGVEDLFKIYENEVVLNDNCIFISTDTIQKVYLPFNILNLLTTTNPVLCSKVENHIRGLLKDSVLISVSGTKERNRFFNKLHQIVDEFRDRIIK
jgi:hypothetical protein